MAHLRACGWLLLALLFAAPAMAADAIRSFRSDGVELAYVDRGRGTPLIFLHGFDASFAQPMAPLAARLGEGFRVIGLDQRGHGRSGKPHDAEAYGTAFADDVLKLMDTLHIEKAQLVGHSMGGVVALYLAAHHPERFDAVVTIGNGLFTRGELDLIGWLFRGQFAWTQLKTWFGVPDPLARPGRDRAALLLAVRSLDALAVSRDEAAAIRVPLLAARGGAHDDPRDTVERLKAVNPAVETLRVESEDHVSLLTSAAFVQCLKRFLARHEPVPDVPASGG